MDKNIAALVREDIFTIGVRFPQNDSGSRAAFNYEGQIFSVKEYTYVCDIAGVKVGDTVVVLANGCLNLATVFTVHDGVDIEPNADRKYSWVVDKLDVERFEASMAVNKEIEETVGKAYQKNIKQQFRNVIMAGLDDASAARLTQLTQKG